MPRHSKNNTASAVFTYAERERLSYGTQKQRLGNDSKRQFDACFLCLQASVEPMSCPKGHIACKECFYGSILSQKKDVEAYNNKLERAQAQREAKQRQEEEEKKQQALSKIEATISVTGANASDAKQDGSKKAALPSFWVPSLTPSTVKDDIPEPEGKKEVQCVADDVHPVSVKKLFPVKFTKDKDSKICPSCSKQLSNGVKMSILKPCGHVLCNVCIKGFVKNSGRCNVCDAKCRPKEVIPLIGEGTSFSALGKSEAKKFDHAFQ